jgi:hypothetical protein
VEGISEPALLALLGGKGLDWLQVEVVVQVQVVEVLAVDQQVEHVVALAAHLQSEEAGGMGEGLMRIYGEAAFGKGVYHAVCLAC